MKKYILVSLLLLFMSTSASAYFILDKDGKAEGSPGAGSIKIDPTTHQGPNAQGASGASNVSTGMESISSFNRKNVEGTSAIDSTSYNILAGKLEHSDMTVSSSPSAMLLNWYDLLKSNAFTDKQRAEFLWVLAGANLLSDYSIKNYNLNKSKGMIILDDAFLKDSALMTEVANLVANINNPPQVDQVAKYDGGRSGSIAASNRRANNAMQAQSKVAAMTQLSTLDSIASQTISNLASDPQGNGMRSQGAFGAVIPVINYSKYVNTPFRQKMTIVDIAKVNMLQNNMFAGDGDAKNVDVVDVNNMYLYLDVAFVKLSSTGKIVPFGKLWKTAWKKTIQQDLKNEDAFSDIDEVKF